MSNVKFNDEHSSQKIQYKKRESFLVRTVLRLGIVKKRKQVPIVLLGVTIVAVILAAFILIKNTTNSTVIDKDAPINEIINY